MPEVGVGAGSHTITICTQKAPTVVIQLAKKKIVRGQPKQQYTDTIIYCSCVKFEVHYFNNIASSAKAMDSSGSGAQAPLQRGRGGAMAWR